VVSNAKTLEEAIKHLTEKIKQLQERIKGLGNLLQPFALAASELFESAIGDPERYLIWSPSSSTRQPAQISAADLMRARDALAK